MATNKKTTFKDKSPKLDDFDLDMGDFDFRSAGEKKDAKRKPIMKVAVNVGKGSLGHFASESFVRNTIGGALPAGYDTAIDTSYEIAGAVGEAYNTAAQEWRKIAPSARRAVDKLLPRAQSVLPKALAARLEKFAKGDQGSGDSQANPDEENLRSVLAELEQTTQVQRLKERNEDEAKEQLRGQIDTRRFNSSIKVMASIDARLAHIQAFNDQAFARFQRRSLEIQYRSYFVQRDMLKLQGVELAAQRQLLQAVVHNTALPDMVKAKAREKYGDGLRERLMGSSQQTIVDYTRGFASRIKDRVKGSIQNIGNGVGMGLQGLQMGQEMMDMQREMGADMTAEASKAFGAMLGSAVTRFIANSVGNGFRRSGPVAQTGAKLNRTFRDLPIKLGKWSSTNTDFGDSIFSNLKGSLVQMAKDHVGGQFRADRRVGTSGVMSAGDPGMYSKRTQRSIEEIIPGYLSHILHELTMTRTGSTSVDRIVWNDDKSRFTTYKQQGQDAMDRVFSSANAKYARSNAGDLADELTAGAVLSPKARQELMQDLILRTMSGEALDPLDYVKGGGKHFTGSKETKLELRKAMAGRFKGANGKLDEVTRAHLASRFANLREAVPDVKGMLSAYNELGAGTHFDSAGITSQEGGDTMMDFKRIAQLMAGDREASPSAPRFSRDTEEFPFRGSNGILQMLDRTIDLRKVPDGPVIVSGKRVSSGSYRNATTNEPIRLMHDVLLGVKDAGKVVVTPEQAAKLLTPTGQTFGEWALQNKRPQMPGGKLSRAYQKVVDKLAKVGGKIDDSLERAQHSKLGKQIRSGKFRRQKLDEAQDWMQSRTNAAGAWAADRTASAAESIMAAAGNVTTPGTAEHSTVQMGLNTVQSTVQEHAKKLKPWITKLKKRWRRVMAVKRYATNLYRKGELQPVIKAEALKAGEYVSAKTRQVIADMRDLADGVMTKDGSWVATAEQVVSDLRLASGEKFTEVMDKAQETIEAIQASPSVQAVTGGASTLLSEGAAAVQRQVAAAASSVSSTAPAMPDSMDTGSDSLLETLVAFKEGNLERLDAILEAVASGGIGGSGQPGAPAGSPSRLRRLLGGAGKALRWGGRQYGRYVKAVFGGMGSVAGGIGRGIGSLFGGLTRKRDALGTTPADVYVKGEKVPRLTAGAMEAGEYFNKNGDPILAPADIKGPVVNQDGTKTYLSLEDFKKGITDGTGRSLIGSVIRGVGGMVGTAAGWLGGYYGLVFRGAGWVAGKAKDILKAAAFGTNDPVDVYVKGDMSSPRLFATGMRAGSYVLVKNPRKKVRGVQDIEGAVRDISDKANIVLTDEDLAKGIVDVNGKPFKVRKSMLGRLASGVGAFGEGYLKLLGSMARGGAALASAPFKLLGWLFGGSRGGKLGKAGKDGVPTADQRTHDLLTEVLNLLDARMPETEHYRAGSWQEKMAKRKAAGGGGQGAAKADAKGGLWGKLKGLFSRKAEDEDDENEEDDNDGGNNTFIDGGSSGEGNAKDARGRMRGSRARNKIAKRLKRARAKGLRGEALRNAGLGRFARMKNAFGRSRLGGKLGGLAKLARGGRLARVGKTLARFRPRGGGLLGIAGGLAAGVGLGAVSDHVGGTAGSILNAASYATMIPGVSGAIMGGLGTAASAIGGGLATAAGVIGSVLTAPVLITAGIIAAVGTAAYFGYKYYGLKKKAPLRKLRMAQYGVDMNKEVMPVGKIQKLEELLLPRVVIGKDGKAHLKGGQPEDEEKILKIFDLKKSWYNPTGWFHSANAQDEVNQKNFLAWIAARFKPVFLNWVAAVHQINPKMALSDCDSDLSPDQKRALLKSVYAMDSSVYAAMASPFGTDPLTAGKAQVDAAYNEALKDLPPPKVAGSAPNGVPRPGAGPVGPDGKPLQAAAAQAAAKDGIAKASSIAAAAAAMKPTTASGKAKALGLVSKSDSKQALAFIGGTVSAQKAIRYKTYGLVEMLPEQVKAVYLLETELMGQLDYDSKGTATYRGDANAMYEAYTGYFGISPTDEPARVRWFAWFAKRFLPTLLAYASAVKRINKATDPFQAEDYLSPQSLLDVANMVIAATYTEGKQTTSVWAFTDSPFGVVALNSDSAITRDNLQALKNAVKQRALDEQTAKKGTTTRKDIEAAADEAKKQIEASKKESTAGRLWGKVKNLFSFGKNTKPPTLPAGAEAGSRAALAAAQGRDISAGQIVPQPGNGTAGDVNKLPMPSGNGQDAMKALLEAVGAMTGVDPKILNTFAGIESSWNPSARPPNGNAMGLFQFMPGTWAEMLTKYGSKYGLSANASRLDPRANALMGAEYLKQNQRYMAQQLGRSPTDVDLYMAHFLGAGGAAQFARAAGSALGSDINPAAAKNNPSIFAQNGQWLTKAGIMKILDDKVAKFRAMGTGMTPKAADSSYAAAATGGNTTTTANGATGGVGPQASFSDVTGRVSSTAGAKALAAIARPASMVAAPPTGPASAVDPVLVSQGVARQKAMAADRQAQATTEAQQAQMGDLTQYLKNQTLLQQQMVELLQGIHGHTGSLPTIAAQGSPSGASDAASGNDRQLAGVQRPTMRSADLPKAPVSVQRKTYSTT